MDVLAERLQLAMNFRGFTQKKLAEQVGVSQQAIGSILNEKTRNPKNILEIANALNVSAEWLKTGKGEVPNFSNTLETDEKENEPVLARIEVLDVYTSAGNGEFITGDLATYTQAVEFESEYFYELFQRASEKGLSIINVKGDSMEPTLCSGDLLFVDTNKNCYQGDGIYVFSFGDVVYVKRLQLAGHKMLILSDNKFYDTWDINASNEYQFFIHGKVEFQQGRIKRVG